MDDPSLASHDATQDLTMESNAMDDIRRQQQPRMRLSLDDLSSEGKEGEEQLTLQSASGASLRMEENLQRRLKRQQEHYARQRQMLEDLRRAGESQEDLVMNLPAAFSSSSVSSHHVNDEEPVRHVRKKMTKQEPQEQLARNGLSRQRARWNDKHPSDANDDSDDQHAAILRKIHTKLNKKHSKHRKTEAVDDLQQQEASNEALRRQLELLRRLQLDNNRFRQETRSLREQNELLEEQNEQQKQQIKRLQDDIHELTVRIEDDQAQLANAAHVNRKFKHCYKQLEQSMAENEKLEAALQEAARKHSEAHQHAQTEVAEAMDESRQLKRQLKQSKAEETRLAEQIDALRAAIASYESELQDVRSQLTKTERENADLTMQCAEKAKQCETLETSATACVERMESGMESIQKAYNLEREKRKKADKAREDVEKKVESQAKEIINLQHQLEDTETHMQHVEEKLRDARSVQKKMKKTYDEKAEEWVESAQRDRQLLEAMRSEKEGLQRQLDAAQKTAMETRRDITQEVNVLRKELESVRHVIEISLRASPSGSLLTSGGELMDSVTMEPSLSEMQQRREEVWVKAPELQYLQGAIGALRNEVMNFIHDFQRSRHSVRQQAHKLSVLQERVRELEHLRDQDATRMKELRDQTVISEQARDITSKEKVEILKWSQQTCERNELLTEELKRCREFVHEVGQKLRFRREMLGKWDAGDQEERQRAKKLSKKTDKNEPNDAGHEELISHSFAAIGGEIDALLLSRDQLQEQMSAQLQENDTKQEKLERLQHEMESKMEESRRMVAEIESLHEKSMDEQKNHLNEMIAMLESEKKTLEDSLKAETERTASLSQEKTQLTALVDRFEQDVPVLATVVHMFVLLIQPLILQVSELRIQKRFLIRENMELVQSQQQMVCVANVLRELLPTPPSGDELDEFQRQQQATRQRILRAFRKTVIAVVAFNRFRIGNGLFGRNTSLKLSKSKKQSFSSSSSASTDAIIKMLPPKPTLAKCSIRKLIDGLRHAQITEKFSDWVDTSAGSSSSGFGSLLLHVLKAMDQDAAGVVLENTNGAFHCAALLERHHRKRSSRHKQQDVSDDFNGTVDFIRQQILALGKRVEDLHFQRNALQKDNYELQFQLEQQATHLGEMKTLVQKCDALQQEMETIKAQSTSEQEALRQQVHQYEDQLRDRASELEQTRTNVQTLQQQLTQAQQEICAKAQEMELLGQKLSVNQSTTTDQDEKIEKLHSALRKQEEDVRYLKQAAKRAHEQHQNVLRRLEHETMDKARLEAHIVDLTKQKVMLEEQLHAQQLEELEKSFSLDTTHGDDDENDDASDQDVLHRSTASSHEPTRLKSPQKAIKKKTKVTQGRHETEEAGTTTECWYHAYEDYRGTAKKTQASLRHTNDLDFASAWRKLQISDTKSKEEDAEDGDSDHQLGVPSPRRRSNENDAPNNRHNPSEILEIQQNRRKIDIEKVNMAVHDYMDRIDEKLHQMYGIPHSNTRSRDSSRIHSDDEALQEKAEEKRSVRWCHSAT